uniref:Uncharacterized protein n=1 Tax=Magallana gigas TaxID=29159 RepID=A0A8W8M778_MAGGI
MIRLCQNKLLHGYKFPVYTTEVCPRNQEEWDERSLALNCTESNAFICLPNENLTELLEFCYTESRIRIQEDIPWWIPTIVEVLLMVVPLHLTLVMKYSSIQVVCLLETGVFFPNRSVTGKILKISSFN